MATIAENLQTIIDIKDNIKTAIENKGVDMTNTPFTEYSTKINEITTGGGTPTKIDVAATGIKLGNSTFTEIPVVFDFSNITDMSGLFYNCDKLTTIPTLDTSNVDNMRNLFSNCSSLQSIPPIDTAKVAYMSEIFYYCSSLQSIPQLNTSKVFDVSNMFGKCTKLQSIPLLDFGNVRTASYFFDFSALDALTDLGGFKNLKLSIINCFLERTPNLTVESLMNVINNLWDWSGNTDGKAPLNSGNIWNFGTTHNLKFGQTNLDKLTEEQIAVATAKGWTLTA